MAFSIMTISITYTAYKTLNTTPPCHFDECRALFIVTPNVILLSVIMLNVITLSVVGQAARPLKFRWWVQTTWHKRIWVDVVNVVSSLSSLSSTSLNYFNESRCFNFMTTVSF